MNRKMLYATMFISMVFILLTTYLSYFFKLENTKKDLYDKSKAVYNNIIKMQMQSIKSIALSLSYREDIIEAYTYDDSQSIIEALNPFWKKVRKEKLLNEIHFFKPPAVSFVNFSAFYSKGRDVSKVRKDIQWVTSTQNSSAHTMVCKTYAGVRATFPIKNKDGKLLGAISMGKKIDWIPENIKSTIDADSFLIYKKEAISNLAKEFYDEFIKGKKSIGSVILGAHTTAIEINSINTIDFDKKIQDFKVKGKTYSLNIIPIIDFSKKNMGYLCVLNDTSGVTYAFFKELTIVIVLLLLATFLIYIFFVKEIKKTRLMIHQMKTVSNDIKAGDFDAVTKFSNKYKDATAYDELSELNLNIMDLGNVVYESQQDLQMRIQEGVSKIEAQHKQMVQQSKLAQMGEMIDMIAHQWRQPLSAILITAESYKIDKALKSKDPWDSIEDKFDKIFKFTQHLSQTIDDFRNFLKEEKSKVSVYLEDLLEESIEIIQPSLDRSRITLINNVQGKTLISTYSSEVKQVILNIIGNAENILLSRKITDPEIHLSVSYSDDKKYVQLHVKDNAGGIDDDVVSKIFDPYFSTNLDDGGTGLGLYMSRVIIEEHCAGEINVKNDKEGAVFSLKFLIEKDKPTV